MASPEELVFEAFRFLASNTSDTGLDEYCLPSADQCGSSDDSEDQWYIGVIISILGSVLSNFGVNTQKYSMIQEVVHGRSRPYAKQPFWLLGLLGVIVGAILDFAALGFAAQSLITPVGGFTMVANLFFANFWLGESITRLDIISTFAIIAGIVLIAAFADKSNQCYTLDSLKCLYKRTAFIPYAVLVGGLIVLVYVAVVILRKRAKAMQDGEKTESWFYKRLCSILPLLCALLSGLIGAQSVLFAKSTIEILKSTARGNHEFSNYVTYLIIIAMFLAILGQIHWLAVALSEFDAVVIVPVFQSVFVSFTIIAGAAYFGEFRNFNHLQTIFFPIGVVILIIGVLGLAKHKSRTPEELIILESEGKCIPDTTGSGSMSEDVESATNNALTAHTGAGSISVGDSVLADETRRESFRRYQEFNNLSPYGAVTGRWIPLEFLLSEVESNLERVGTFLHRASNADEADRARDDRRHRSFPARGSAPISGHDEDGKIRFMGDDRELSGAYPVHHSKRRNLFSWRRTPGSEEEDEDSASIESPRRTDKSSSFAVVEQFLNFGSSRSLSMGPRRADQLDHFLHPDEEDGTNVSRKNPLEDLHEGDEEDTDSHYYSDEDEEGHHRSRSQRKSKRKSQAKR